MGRADAATPTLRTPRSEKLPLFAGAFLVAAIVGLIALVFIYESAQEWVRHTQEVEGKVDSVLNAVQAVELAVRGYALTGAQTYRQRIKRDHTRFLAELEELQTLTSDNAVQQGAVSRMRKQAEIHFGRNAPLFNDQPVASPSVQTVSLDPLRETAAAMRRHEASLLRTRIETAGMVRMLTMLAVAAALLAAGFVSVLWLRDRTERTQAIAGKEAAETQVAQLQKMEAVGRLTGGIAHDFNNMLAVILSALSMIDRRRAAGNPDIAMLLEAARDAAQRGATLTQRLLAFSRQQPLAPKPLDMNRLVAGMSELLKRTLGEDVQLETVHGGGLWRTNTDAAQLESALLNLAINARDAMPGGGRLTIETANAFLDDAYARAHEEVKAGQYAMIAVSDTGTGMNAKTIERAFEPFFTTKPTGKGTGLGLSQVYGFVKQSGGHVKIYSELGQGTAVKIYLPRHQGEDAEAVVAQDMHAPEGKRAEVILVVEDESRLREIAVAALDEAGYTTIAAGDGKEALTLLDSHPEICCLFTDVVMPGMSGRELADEATKRRPDLKVLYTTGYTQNAIIHGGVLDAGVNFLPKPFTAYELARKLRETLGPPPA